MIPPAIITGQAAGTAAAQALEAGCPIVNVDIARLQSSLEKANVMIHFDDALIPGTECKDAGAQGEDFGHI